MISSNEIKKIIQKEMLRKLGNSRPLAIAFMGRGNVYGKISAVPLMILSSEVYDEDWPTLKKI